MKKILFAFVIGFSSITASGNLKNPLDSNLPVVFSSSGKQLATLPYQVAVESPSYWDHFLPSSKKFYGKALNDFERRYKKISDVKWFADRHCYISYFKNDGCRGMVYYNRTGCWQYSLVFYGEDKLPRDIRNVVKSTYFDQDITHVEEIQINEGMTFIIHVEDRFTIWILKVSKNGEMEIMHKLAKS